MIESLKAIGSNVNVKVLKFFVHHVGVHLCIIEKCLILIG